MFERRQCPQEFQDRLTQVVGRNPYGEPLFLIAWSQTHTFRAGGVWPHDHYAGYRDVFTATGSPSKKLPGYWMILEWVAPYTSEAVWRYLNRDEDTGLQTLGEFPHSGSYRVALKLQTQEVRNGKLVLESMPLDSQILDSMMPLILAAKDMSHAKRMELARADRVRAEEKEHKAIEDMVGGSRAAFKGRDALSFAGQRNTNNSVAQRMQLIERQWTQFLNQRKSAPRGFGQGRPFA